MAMHKLTVWIALALAAFSALRAIGSRDDLFPVVWASACFVYILIAGLLYCKEDEP